MVCRLCLKEADNVIEIFGEEGRQLDIVTTLQKYFDNLELKPNDDDFSKDICKDCWTTVSEFREFCLVIDEAQLKWKNENYSTIFEPEVVIIKSEPYESELFENEPQLKEELTEDVLQNTPENVDVEELPSDIDKKNQPRRRSKRSCVNKKDTVENGKDASDKSPDVSDNSENTSSPSESRKRKPKVTPPTTTTTIKRIKIVPKTVEKIKENNETDQEKDAKISAHMPLICELCQEHMPTFSCLRSHMRYTHQVKGWVKCCNKKFFKRIMLLEHIELHTNPEFFKCNICGKLLADRKCYGQHMLLKHATEEEKTYFCDQCPKSFAKSYLLVNHQILHRERNHICEVCQSAFPSIAKLNNHRKVKHLNYGLMCEICAKVMQGPGAFETHMKEHQGIPIPKVQCSVCGSWHKNKYSLQKHMRKHKESGTEFVCNICGKQSPNHNALVVHQRYMHETQRNHVCNICQKSFKRPLLLKEHMSVHTGEMLYNCPHCPRKFMTSASMYIHRKKLHPKEFEKTQSERRNSSIPMKTLMELTKVKEDHKEAGVVETEQNTTPTEDGEKV